LRAHISTFTQETFATLPVAPTCVPPERN